MKDGSVMGQMMEDRTAILRRICIYRDWINEVSGNYDITRKLMGVLTHARHVRRRLITTQFDLIQIQNKKVKDIDYFR
jgi:hypothetical protein